MNKTILFSLLFFVTFGVCAQDNASIEFHSKIKLAVTDTTSQYYYPKLLEKFKTNPADITENDCFYLYYGDVFQMSIKRIGGGLSFLRNPERADFDKATMKGNCKKVIELGKIMLERNPMDLTVLLHTSVCVDKQNNIEDKYISQIFKNLLSAIFSTGDGKTKDAAIKIVSPEDDYVIKGVVGFLGGKETHMFDDSGAYTIAYSIWEKGNEKLYFEEVINPER